VYAAALGRTDLATRQRHGFKNTFEAKGGLLVKLFSFSPVFLIGHVSSSVSHSSAELFTLAPVVPHNADWASCVA